MRVSAVVLTKNNQDCILRCLNSLNFCNEILVVDDFSTDKTVEIVKKLKNVKLIKRNLDNDFSKQRNYALKVVKNNWILFIDSDEIVSEQLKTYINSIPEETQINGYYIRRQDVLWGKYVRYSEFGRNYILRLGRKDMGMFSRKVHEKWIIKGRTKNIEYPILHFSHNDISDFIDNINKKSSLHACELKNEDRKSNINKIILYPILKFINNYFIRGGFLDGNKVFVAVMIMSFHSFLSWSKLWLIQKKDH